MDEFPKPERDQVQFLASRLWELERFAEQFVEAVALRQHMEERMLAAIQRREDHVLLMGWSTIPCRDACMTLYHYCKLIEGFQIGPDCPTFAKTVDAKTIRQTRRDFREQFPDIFRLRNSIAHAGEINETPAKKASNIVTAEDGGQIQVTNSIGPRGYTQTFEGVLLEVAVDVPTAQFLNNLTAQFFSAFETS